MSKLSALTFFGEIIGLTSTIFMLWVFWNESAYGRGVLFFEPNRPLAGFEFGICFFGLLIQTFVLIALTLFSKADVCKMEVQEVEEEEIEMGVPKAPERLYQ